MEEQSTGDRRLAGLEPFARENSGASHVDFERFLRDLKGCGVPVAEWNEVVAAAFNQIGYWGSEWLFSPEQSPNDAAELELVGWEQIADACQIELARTVPELEKLLKDKREHVVLGYALRKRLKYNERRPFERAASGMLSNVALYLNRLGLRGVANFLYKVALYPKGTVGRHL